jgi:hypothetical protein
MLIDIERGGHHILRIHVVAAMQAEHADVRTGGDCMVARTSRPRPKSPITLVGS